MQIFYHNIVFFVKNENWQKLQKIVTANGCQQSVTAVTHN
jgi:hypothetical protein